MATFHQFPCLPSELRARIWELTIEPRVVDVSVSDDYLRDKGPLPVTSTPVPAPLQTCQESRLELQKYYQRGLSELGDGNEPRYVWIDFEVDIVSIGSTEFCVYERVALSPRRLQFQGENSDDLFYHFGMKDLMLFRHLKEVFVVCKDGFSSWAGALEDHLWPCDVDNIWMIDPVDGKMVKGAEVDAIFEMESRERTLRMFYDYDTGLPILPFIEDAIEQEQ
ncbi:hypothetical protein DPSP01_013411 [Paraphaeosphaeria sporulosa]